MIRIGRLNSLCTENAARIVADVDIDGVSVPLWIEVAKEFGEAICSSRSDAFVVGLLFVAIQGRHDVQFVTPITDELKEGLERDFLDVICQHQPDLYHVKLIGPTASAISKEERVHGTGISCGVDSLYTYFRRMNQPNVRECLVLANMHGDVPNETSEIRKERFEYIKNNAINFAKDAGKGLVVVDTNYNNKELPGLGFEGCTTYGNLFVVMALQNMFTKYYIASGGPIEDFKKYIENGIYGTDCSDYDLLLLSAVSTSSLKFVVDGLDRRTDKVLQLCKEPLAWKYLDVCHVHKPGRKKNGTYDCPKCMHTVLEIMAVGPNELEKFSQVFDVGYVKTHRWQYCAEMIRQYLNGYESGQELWNYRCKLQFSYLDYVRAMRILLKKIFLKLLRRGRVSNNFSPQ